MESLFTIQHSYLIPLLPLAGAIIAGFFCTGSRNKFAHWPIWIGVLGSAVLAFMLLFGMAGIAKPQAAGSLYTVVNLYSWIDAGNFHVSAGYLFDPLTAVMLCVVCGIGFLITVFSAGYMKGEKGYFRFFAYLGLFIFMMTNLVMGENLVMLYLGWEGVGLCSYLLIGYYYDKPAAREAAKKAFLVNRVGDFGFALGIMLSFMAFGSVSYFHGGHGLLELAAKPQAAMTAFQITAMKWIPFLLMVGAFGKSAQFPLYVWLPDAMEGPTPVSALIHAATMVTAGVYMIVRCGTLFVGNTTAMLTIAAVGTFTAVFAASIALRQFDLKKVFAYSTVSQLGFMFAGVGVLAPVAGVFHLITHAFFKALLFLSCGVVMHAMAGELDMRKMSGLKKVLPRTRLVMLIGCLALAGFPLFSGFWSKDMIVDAVGNRANVLWIVLLGTAFLTAYYTFRLYFRVFEGPTIIPPPPADAHSAHGPDSTPHQPDQDIDEHLAHSPDHGSAAHGHDDRHNHEPALMMLPLYLLAIGALFAGVINLPFSFALPAHALGDFLGHSPSLSLAYEKALSANQAIDPAMFGQKGAEAAEEFSVMPLVVGGIISILGIFLAYLMHLKDRGLAGKLAERFPGVVKMLDHKYWVDEIYQNGIVEPLRSLGQLFFAIDRWIVDGIVNTIGLIPQVGGFIVKLLTQRGYLQGYAAAMVLGIVVILLFVLL
jgi:NADH-quinone oxidoreductase subunit L